MLRIEIRGESCRWALAVWLIALAGCGGGRVDPRKYALRRSSSDEGEVEGKQSPGGSKAGLTGKREGASVASAASGAAPQRKAEADPADSAPAPPATHAPPAAAGGAEKPSLIQPLDRTFDQSRSEMERRQWVLDSLQRIAGGMRLWMSDTRYRVPPPYVADDEGNPLLSWRVAILPHLGYDDLYREFNLKQPWDSPHNLKLLQRIPSEYQSPERGDERTNFQAPLELGAMFKTGRGLRLELEALDNEGLENVIMLLEVDDALAVPWTKPADYVVTKSLDGLGHVRSDGLFVVFADRLIRRIDNSVPTEDVLSLFVIDDRGRSAKLAKAVFADPNQTIADSDGLLSREVLPGGDARPALSAAGAGAGAIHAAKLKPPRKPVPEKARIDAARTLAREIYGEMYEQARTSGMKKLLATSLLSKADAVGEDLPALYVLLTAARDVALQAAEFELAIDAVNRLIAEFEVDEYPVYVETLRRAGQGEPAEMIYDYARKAAEASLQRDDFQTGRELLAIARAAHAKAAPDGDARSLLHLTQRIELGAALHRKMERALAAFGADRPEAKAAAGKYYCLAREDWARGLPFLAEANDPALKTLADWELGGPATGEEKLTLADAWSDLSRQVESRHRMPIQRHATVWYLLAEQALPKDGLLRVKAELRVRDAEKELGIEDVDDLRKALAFAH